jgi:hypothetical protein
MLDVLFDVGLQAAQDLRPASIAGGGTFAYESRVRQANRRGAVFLFQIPAHKGLRRVFLPVSEPREDQQVWTVDFAILSGHSKGLIVHADAAHKPLAPGRRSDSTCVIWNRPLASHHHFRRSPGLVRAPKIRSAEAFIVIS